MPASLREFSVIGRTCHRWRMRVECYQIPVPLVPLPPQPLGKTAAAGGPVECKPQLGTRTPGRAPLQGAGWNFHETILFSSSLRCSHVSAHWKSPHPLTSAEWWPSNQSWPEHEMQRNLILPLLFSILVFEVLSATLSLLGSAHLSVSSKKQTSLSSLSFSFLGEMDFLGREN